MQGTLVGSKVYLFGGEDAAHRPQADLYVLDLADKEWQQSETTGDNSNISADKDYSVVFLLHTHVTPCMQTALTCKTRTLVVTFFAEADTHRLLVLLHLSSC